MTCSRGFPIGLMVSLSALVGPAAAPSIAPAAYAAGREYPWHTNIVATTFWVGEIFDPHAPDGSQVTSTHDERWMEHYGGCDGILVDSECQTERRTAADGFFPTRMEPRQNPFYLDLPYDDVHDRIGFSRRARVIPWAHDPRYAAQAGDRSFSLLKNRWVKLTRRGRTCYGQIEDAGPGRYHDARYVFGATDARPANKRFNHAGMDVSPALNACLAFGELNGQNDRVNWRFIDDSDVPAGPWKKITTTAPVTSPDA